MTLVCNPIRQRKVVRVGRERADVWLFSGRSFDALKQRIGRIIDAALELPSGHRLQRWGAMDDANTFEIQVKGSEVARVRIHRHLDGALVIIAGIAKTAKMPPWLSPYRPAPVNLPHGPLR